MLENVTLSKKLMGGFITVAVITLIVGYAGYGGIGGLSGRIYEIGEVCLPNIQQLSIAQKELESLRVAQRTLLNPYLNDEDHKRQFNNLAASREKFAAALAVYESLPSAPEEAEEYKKFNIALADFKKSDAEFEDLAKKTCRNRH